MFNLFAKIQVTPKSTMMQNPGCHLFNQSVISSRQHYVKKNNKRKYKGTLQGVIITEFEGVTSGVSKWGLFVELSISKSEGLIRIQNMKDDYYVFDEDNYRMLGRHTGMVYQLGDKVNVLVKKVDLGRRQLDFELAE